MKLIFYIFCFLGTTFAWGRRNDCVPDWRAREIVEVFEGLFSDGNLKKIKATVTKDFTVYSDSQEWVTPGMTPVSGAAITTGRDAFAAAYPPHPGAANVFQTLDVFHSCTQVAFRWVVPGGFGGTNPIRGIDTLDLKKENGQWKIHTDYSEWNNVAFLAGFKICTIC